MALDFFAISSQGVFVTPTPTGALRSALNVSQGLLNIALPAPPDITDNFLGWGRLAWEKLRWARKRFGIR